MIDRLTQHELMRRELSTKPHPVYGHSFPFMTLPSKTTADERKRLEVQALPFALPRKKPVQE